MIIKIIINFYKTISSKKSIFIFIVFLVGIIFKTPIEEFFSVALIAPILSKIQLSKYSDWGFILFAIFISAYFIPKFLRRYIISWEYFLSALLIITYYWLFYRNDSSVFSLTPFKAKCIKVLYYADIIILFNSFVLLLYFKENAILFFNRIFPVKKKATEYYVDEPIDSSKQDILNRTDLAEQIANTIINTYSNKSIAYGVVGEWGSGKTSMMNITKTFLSKDEFIIVDFTPWISFSKNDIIYDFFKVVSDKIKKYSSELPSLFLTYAKEISDYSGNNKLSIITGLLKDLHFEDYNSRAESIDKILLQIDKRVIIFIDDLDRVEPSVIINIIQLIRSSADFKNFIFIVGYDKSYVTNALKESGIHNAENYLEKIFANEFTLPLINDEILKTFVLEALIEKIPSQKQEITNAIVGEVYYPSIFNNDIIKTIRDAKRFLNYFYSSYSSKAIKGEVCFEDFFHIELLRFKYYQVYLLFETNGYIFLTQKSKYNAVKGTKEYALSRKEDGDNEYTIKNFLNKHRQDLLIKEGEVEIVMGVLVSVFPDDSIHRFSRDKGILSIRNPDNYHKYFARRISPNDLSEEEFNKYYSSDFDSLKAKIEEWLDQGKRSLIISRFKQIKLDDIRDIESYKKHILSLFTIGRYKEKTPKGLVTGYDIEDLYYKIQWDKRVKKIFNDDSEQFKMFLLEIFNNAPAPYFFDSEVLFYIYDQHEYDFIIEEEKVNNLRLGYLKKLCDDSNVFSNDVWALYHNCDLVTREQVGAGTYRRNKNKNPKAIEILLNLAKKFPHDIIPKTIDYHFDDQKAISSFAVTLFGDFPSYWTFIDSFDEDKFPYLIDVKGLYKEFEKTKFKNYVNYTFQYLPNERPN